MRKLTGFLSVVESSPYPWLGPFSNQLGVPAEDLQRIDFERVACADQLNLRVAELNLPAAVFDRRFEHSSSVLKALAYEQRVSEGLIPTRNLGHDWFNGLIWLRWPRMKHALNHFHLQSPDVNEPSALRRTPRRDALTLWDESGLLLLVREPKWLNWLELHDWAAFFVENRALWATDVYPLVVGHGLLDALRNPHKGLCAKVHVVCWPAALDAFNLGRATEWFDELDRYMVNWLERLQSPRALRPLPVMGIPGWFEVNQQIGFYDDASVFRKKPTSIRP